MIHVFSPSTQYLSDGANALPTLHRVWGLCSTRAVTLSPLLCQPGHGTGVVCKHTHTKWILLGCCFCFSWVSSEQWLRMGGVAQRTARTLVGKTPRSDLYLPLGEEKREIPCRPGWRWTAPAQHHPERWDGSCRVCWWFCAYREGNTFLQHKEVKSGKEGMKGWMGMSMNSRGNFPGL